MRSPEAVGAGAATAGPEPATDRTERAADAPSGPTAHRHL